MLCQECVDSVASWDVQKSHVHSYHCRVFFRLEALQVRGMDVDASGLMTASFLGSWGASKKNITSSNHFDHSSPVTGPLVACVIRYDLKGVCLAPHPFLTQFGSKQCFSLVCFNLKFCLSRGFRDIARALPLSPLSVSPSLS